MGKHVRLKVSFVHENSFYQSSHILLTHMLMRLNRILYTVQSATRKLKMQRSNIQYTYTFYKISSIGKGEADHL